MHAAPPFASPAPQELASEIQCIPKPLGMSWQKWHSLAAKSPPPPPLRLLHGWRWPRGGRCAPCGCSREARRGAVAKCGRRLREPRFLRLRFQGAKLPWKQEAWRQKPELCCIAAHVAESAAFSSTWDKHDAEAGRDRAGQLRPTSLTPPEDPRPSPFVSVRPGSSAQPHGARSLLQQKAAPSPISKMPTWASCLLV